MPAPTIPVVVGQGDKVQATHQDLNGAVTVTTFMVTRIRSADGFVSGSPVLGALDPAVWTVELVEKDPSNLNLPTDIAEIAAWMRTAEVLHLTGKRNRWRNEDTGRRVDPEMILGWKDWDVWAAEVAAYEAELASSLPPAEAEASG